MKKTTSALLAVLGTATLAGRAQAQVPVPNITPFSVEARAGLSVPLSPASDNAKTGWTAGANVTYHALPLVGVYAGYTLDEWKAKDADGKFQSQAISVGARIGIPTPMIPIDPWIKVGAVNDRIKITDNSSGASLTGDRKWGFEAGAGLGFTLGPKLSVTPGVTYTKVKDLKFVRADIGLRVRI